MPSHWHLNVFFKTVACILLFFRFLVLLRHGFPSSILTVLFLFIILIVSSVFYFLFVLLLLLTHRGKKQYFDCPVLFWTFSVDIISTLTTNKSCLTSFFLFFLWSCKALPFYFRTASFTQFNVNPDQHNKYTLKTTSTVFSTPIHLNGPVSKAIHSYTL